MTSRRRSAVLLAFCATVVSQPGSRTLAAGSFDTAGQVITGRAHVSMDLTNAPASSALRPGARPSALTQARVAFPNQAASQPSDVTSALLPRAVLPSGGHAREILGFAQSGEVSSGAWRSDIRFDLVSTVAYFGININGDGSLVTTNTGYATWQSQSVTDLINVAHRSGDRVVLTVKVFDDPTIAAVTGSVASRSAAVANIVSQVGTRAADGVNVDFEGSSAAAATNFTQFVAQLRAALQVRLPSANYLTIDTYASAAAGGTMYDIRSLSQYVDAFDVMAYDITSPASSQAGPVAPLGGMRFADSNTVADFLALVPRWQVILGIPYYGYKWSVSNPSPQAPTLEPASADTYSAIKGDFACAEQLTQRWDVNFASPWATWWSPAANDPCGGNHSAWRELYFENAASLGAKYDLVNSADLLGIGIWALGYDSGSQDLWNVIAAKLTVPEPVVSPLPGSEASTSFALSWAMPAGSPPIGYYVVWVQAGSGGPWQLWSNVAGNQVNFFGFRGRQYGFSVQAVTTSWRSSGQPSTPLASTTVSSSATSPVPFTSMYAVDGYGLLQPASSPPMDAPRWPGWDIVRDVALTSDGQGGVVLDGWGGLHSFGTAGTANASAYWRGWDIARRLVPISGSAGWVMDGWGGLHPYSLNAAAPPHQPTDNAYWFGWSIARAAAAFPDGSGGVVLDGFGGVHAFATSAGVPAPIATMSYWSGWDIARDIVLASGSTVDSYAGYVLDAFGGLHPFASQGRPIPPPIQISAYWPNSDMAHALILVPGSSEAGYVVDLLGGFHPFGGAPAVTVPSYSLGGATVRAGATA